MNISQNALEARQLFIYFFKIFLHTVPNKLLFASRCEALECHTLHILRVDFCERDEIL